MYLEQSCSNDESLESEIYILGRKRMLKNAHCNFDPDFFRDFDFC